MVSLQRALSEPSASPSEPSASPSEPQRVWRAFGELSAISRCARRVYKGYGELAENIPRVYHKYVSTTSLQQAYGELSEGLQQPPSELTTTLESLRRAFGDSVAHLQVYDSTTGIHRACAELTRTLHGPYVELIETS